MKKALSLALGLGVLSTSAFATKARMVALGQSVEGSQYIDDTRNKFLNVATINKHKDYIELELGGAGNTAGVNGYKDSDANPKASGGFIKSYDNYVYGLYLGDETNNLVDFRGQAFTNTLATNEQAMQNDKVDLFFGGDAGVEWGVNLTYSSSSDEPTGTGNTEFNQDSLSSRFGVLLGDLEAFFLLSLMNEVELGTANFEGDLGFKLGANYTHGEYTFFGFYRTANWDQRSRLSNLTGEGSSDKIQLGVAREIDVTDKSMVFFDFTLDVEQSELEQSGVETLEKNVIKLPFTLGFEADVRSWLVVRGSIKQNLYSNVEYAGTVGTSTAAGLDQAANGNLTSAGTNNGDFRIRNSTDVNAGVTVKLGDFSVDAMIGTTDDANRTAADAAAAKSKDTITRVAATYKF